MSSVKLIFKMLIRKEVLRISRFYSKNAQNFQWKSVVGLEVHAQIASKSKLFSRAPNEFASPVNTNVSLFDCSVPGTLPILNKKCVEAAVLTAIALNCHVNSVSMFDRKHYFYADLPAGYQITQQRSPLADNGLLEFLVYTTGKQKFPYKTKARIKQIQLEQDSGKSLHEDDCSLVDLNRAGAPLMELVFEPDLKDGEEAAALIKELVLILQRIGTCSCKMEEGALRVDANVSVHKQNEPFGTRTEVKNIGSVRGVAGAIRYEVERQIKILENGGSIVNETRSWDANAKMTVSMRDKEEQQDYRYMPEPNLPPLHIAVGPIQQGCVNVGELKNQIPELPEETRMRLNKDLGLTLEQAVILVNEPQLLQLFESVLKENVTNPKLLANIILNDLLTVLNKEKLELEQLLIPGNLIANVVQLFQNKTINHNTTKLLLYEIVFGNKQLPSDIVKERNWAQINDHEIIEEICLKIVEENPKIVLQYKSGKTKVFKAFMGMIAAKTKQKANMAVANEMLKKILNAE